MRRRETNDMLNTIILAQAAEAATEAATQAHGMPEGLLKLLTLGYLSLPLLLGAVAGICLLIAAIRKSLTGGAALALGGLSAVVVLGLIYAGQSHEALMRSEQLHGLSPKLIHLLALGYTVLPLFLAIVAGLSLLFATLRKSLDGATALALGGLGGVVVAGTVFAITAHVNPPQAPATEAAAADDTEIAFEAESAAAAEMATLEDALRGELESVRAQHAALATAHEVTREKVARATGLAERVTELVAKNATLEERTRTLAGALESASGETAVLRQKISALEAALEAARAAAPAPGGSAPGTDTAPPQ
jgi:hypothetical protein